MSPTIFFKQKPHHRERQQDTYKIGSTLFPSFSSIKQGQTIKNTAIEKKWSGLSLAVILWRLLQLVPIINLRKVDLPKDQNIDYIYTWWDIPLFGKTRYVIEIDNPYILTLYNPIAFRIYRPIIRWLLLRERCHKIVCISEACQSLLGHLLGKEVYEKSVVVYPYMSWRENNKHTDDVVRFGFIGFRVMWKWCLELLEAFHKRDEKNIELHIVGFRSEEIEAKYKDDTRIIFHGPKDRKEILENILPSWDIFVFPTLFESLGVVVLEALSAGLGIITTDVFALPDIIQDGYNGKIIPNPHMKKEKIYDRDIVNVVQYNGATFALKFGITEKTYSPDLEKHIYESLGEWILHKDEWTKNAEKVFEEKFGEKIWKEKFISLFP